MTQPDERAARRVRVTIRCLRDDLGQSLPPADVDLGDVDHVLMAECRRLAATAPDSQKRILSIPSPLVFRVAHGRWRGATWVEEDAKIMWLLAAELREEGSLDDAYVYFSGLLDAGTLLPSDDDRLRDRVEAGARFIDTARHDVASLLEEAASTPGAERDAIVAGRIPVFAFVERTGEADWIWFAVSLRGADATAVRDRERDVVFALAEEAAGGMEWEWVRDWPTARDLEWYEVAKLGLRPQC